MPYKNVIKIILIALLVFPFIADADSNVIYLVNLDASINPITKDYVVRAIERANEEGAALLIIQLDTPGGLMESMRDIVEAILNSKVPIVVYVGPAGSRAGSAGVFITLAANVAVMANATHIGAAHPVAITGETPDDTMTEKIAEDAAAYARSIAEKRGRNTEWAERAVMESDSITATEALENNVIDFIADSLKELLEKLDGYEVSEGRVIKTGDASLKKIEMGLKDRFLNYLADPNLVYLLLLIGTYALIYEFFNPGIGFGLAVGGISLLLAFMGLQILPVNIVGLALIAFGALLMILDVFTPTYGILTTGGIISLLAGSFTLFDIESPVFRLSWINIVVTVATVTLLFTFVISKGLLIQRKRVFTGAEGMIGSFGEAREDIIGEGTVFIKGEYWKAIAPYDELIREGDKIVVEGIEGRKLVVRKR
jgi:membrane-bound serine protease (ClpP class)